MPIHALPIHSMPIHAESILDTIQNGSVHETIQGETIQDDMMEVQSPVVPIQADQTNTAAPVSENGQAALILLSINGNTDNHAVVATTPLPTTIPGEGRMPLKLNLKRAPCVCRCGCRVQYSVVWRKNSGRPGSADLCNACGLSCRSGTGCA